MNITNNNILKKLILSLILVVTLGNFVMPNYVHADLGGELAKPLFELVTWVGDKVIEFLQKKVRKSRTRNKRSDLNMK